MKKATRARQAAPEEKRAPDWLGMHRTMLLIRHFEEAVRSLASAGAVPGLAHLCAGQEATNVGVIAALDKRDMIASHHRGHGHCLAKGSDVTGLLAEILGRETGLCGGRSGSMHVFDLENGNLGTNGIVGGGIPLAAGAALAARARGSNEVFVCFFGDGALNQGLLHECMNMAAIWKLPVLFVCENNGYGEFTAIDDVTAGPSITGRGEVFGIPSRMVDGMDVRAVHGAAARRSACARGKGAVLHRVQHVAVRRASRGGQAGLQGGRGDKALAGARSNPQVCEAPDRRRPGEPRAAEGHGDARERARARRRGAGARRAGACAAAALGARQWLSRAC